MTVPTPKTATSIPSASNADGSKEVFGSSGKRKNRVVTAGSTTMCRWRIAAAGSASGASGAGPAQAAHSRTMENAVRKGTESRLLFRYMGKSSP